MSNNNNKNFPGQKLHNQAQAPAAHIVPNIPKPQAQPKAQPARAAQPQPRNTAQPDLPFSALFRSSAKPGALSPAKRAIMAIGGLALWGWGGYLTNVFMQNIFPQLKGTTAGDVGALVATVAASLIFLLIELHLWDGGHAPFMWLILLTCLGLDIYMNVRGFLDLISVQRFDGLTNEGKIFAVVVGTVTAFLPEKIMNRAWRA